MEAIWERSLPHLGHPGSTSSSHRFQVQQSLLSWAEFMAEQPVKPKRRNGKPQPATKFMFEWAMELEREKETVGAGR